MTQNLSKIHSELTELLPEPVGSDDFFVTDGGRLYLKLRQYSIVVMHGPRGFVVSISGDSERIIKDIEAEPFKEAIVHETAEVISVIRSFIDQHIR